MLEKLFFALFGRKKKAAIPEKHQAVTEPPELPHLRANARMEQRLRNERTKSMRITSSSPTARQDDALTNPLHPLSPLNPINAPSSSCRTHDPVPSHCDDSHRSSWGSSSCSSSDSSYSSSD